MADYQAPLQPNLNSITPKVKKVVAQPTLDPIKTKWSCPICLKTMPHLVRDCHIKLHATFCCPKCNAEIPLNNLGCHVLECMDIFTPQLFVCWVCGAAECNMRHMKVKHISQLTCSIPGCGRYFSPDAFISHIKSCIKTYTKRIESSHPMANPTTPKMQKQQATDNKVQFKCLFCTSVFSKESLLQNHIDRLHIKHICPVCTARDITEANFRDHIAKCLKKRSSEDRCPICCKLLANTTNHIHNVHSSLMISCPSCRQKYKCGAIGKHTIVCQKQTSSETSKSDPTTEYAPHSENTPLPSYYEKQRSTMKSTFAGNSYNSRPVPSVTPVAGVFIEDDFPPLNNPAPKPVTFSEAKPKTSQQPPANKPPVSVKSMRSISPDSNSDSELLCLFYEDN